MGGWENISQFIFKSTDPRIKEAIFEASGTDIIIAGHCGLPFYDKLGSKIWINPGVIGMPANNGSTDVWYAILDEKHGNLHLDFRTFAYDFAKAQTLMMENNLPTAYAMTLGSGLWDNCDILPEEETRRMGEVIGLGRYII